MIAHAPRALRPNTATEDKAPYKGTPNVPVMEETKAAEKSAMDVPGLSGAGSGPGKENVRLLQPNALPPLRPEVNLIIVDMPVGPSHIPHLQSTSNPARNPLTGIPRPRPNNQNLSAIGTTHSRTNSTSSGIPGPSAVAMAATQRPLSLRLAEAFSAFDSIVNPEKPATAKVRVPATVHIPPDSHSNISMDETHSIISA